MAVGAFVEVFEQGENVRREAEGAERREPKFKRLSDGRRIGGGEEGERRWEIEGAFEEVEVEGEPDTFAFGRGEGRAFEKETEERFLPRSALTESGFVGLEALEQVLEESEGIEGDDTGEGRGGEVLGAKAVGGLIAIHVGGGGIGVVPLGGVVVSGVKASDIVVVVIVGIRLLILGRSGGRREIRAAFVGRGRVGVGGGGAVVGRRSGRGVVAVGIVELLGVAVEVALGGIHVVGGVGRNEATVTRRRRAVLGGVVVRFGRIGGFGGRGFGALGDMREGIDFAAIVLADRGLDSGVEGDIDPEFTDANEHMDFAETGLILGVGGDDRKGVILGVVEDRDEVVAFGDVDREEFEDVLGDLGFGESFGGDVAGAKLCREKVEDCGFGDVAQPNQDFPKAAFGYLILAQDFVEFGLCDVPCVNEAFSKLLIIEHPPNPE